MAELTHIHAKIIHVHPSRIGESENRRSIYLKTELIPSLTQFGIVPKVHSAVLGKDLNVIADRLNYGGESFRVGLDWNTGNYPSKNSIALSLSHMQIWKEVVETNIPMLVMEDDIQVPVNGADMLYTKECMTSFLRFTGIDRDDAAVLYLQSSCPWQQKQKFYPQQFLVDLADDFYQISSQWHDMSGTASYLITPTSAQKMLDYFKSSPITQIDQMFIMAHHQKAFRYVVPKDYRRNFSLHPTVSCHSTMGQFI